MQKIVFSIVLNSTPNIPIKRAHCPLNNSQSLQLRSLQVPTSPCSRQLNSPSPSMKLFVCLLALIGAAIAQSEIDFCAVKTKYCGTKNHIACLPNNFTPTGLSANPVPIELTQAQKDLILNMHNQYRQQLANGTHAGIKFPSAQKMGEMKWDNTLEHVAKVHAAYGEFKHDECRATPDFRYSGQNLAMSMSTGTVDVTGAIKTGITNWYNEINIADPALITKLLSSHMAAGHFTVMVNDQNNFVGCGASKFQYTNGRVWNAVMLTCNYQYTNMLNSPVYTTGEPCTGCTNGPSAQYPSLCAAK